MPTIHTGPANSPAPSVTKAGKTTKDSKTGDAKLKAACTDFEAVFVNMMLGEMRKTVPKNGLLPKSSGQDIMQSMLDTEMTKNMAHAGGIGLADMLYRQLTLAKSAVNIPNNKGQAPS
jgi:peptidoglycan hydrolase FlgJ